MSAIRLGTRASTLATTQSEMVAGLLRSEGLDVNLTTITTHGDTSTASLAAMGGIGVFASAIRAALLEEKPTLPSTPSKIYRQDVR